MSVLSSLLCSPRFSMIVIDASPAVHHKAGLGRYAEDLIGELKAERVPLTAFYHDAANAKPSALIKSLPQLATAQSPYNWRLRALMAQIANLSQDDLLTGDGGRRTGTPTGATATSGPASPVLFHATEHLLPRFKQVKTVFTLHDLIFKFYPRYHLPRNWIYLQVAMPLFLRRADAIICVSEHTKRDAQKIYGVPEARIRVIREGIHPRFKPVTDVAVLQRVRERYNLPEQYVLALGTIEPRKNLMTLFEAFKALLADGKHAELSVVVGGKQGWLFHETYRAVHERGLTGRVKFIGYVEDQDLPAVYTMARAMAFPSVYEGFGLPPLEAMACGVPVLCSNASSMPELVGDSALLLPPMDADAWAGALQRVLTDRALALDLRRRGPQQSAHYTWTRAARETREVYASLGVRMAH